MDIKGIGICGFKSGVLVSKGNVLGISAVLINNALVHEIGHALGCQVCVSLKKHDPSSRSIYEDCHGNIIDGKYIMHPHAKYFAGTNANKFSVCSISQMEGIVESKARTKCLKCM